MARTEISGTDHANNCYWGHSLALHFRTFAAVALYQRLMPDNQEPIARYAGSVDRATRFHKDALGVSAQLSASSFGSSPVWWR